MNSRTTHRTLPRTNGLGLAPRDVRDVVAKAVGLVPAAGIASRLTPSVYPKELLPVTFDVDPRTGVAMPVPVIELSLRALAAARIERCMVTLSPRKPELLRYLGDGSHVGLQVSYVQQMEPTGLVDAIRLGCRWIQGCYGCLLLPDTVVSPPSAMATLLDVMARDPADAVLGVFPTSRPEQLGPVRFDADGVISEVLEKPTNGTIANTWGMVVFSPAFVARLAAGPPPGTVSGAERITSLADVFNQAIASGSRLRAVWFEDGTYLDAGTPAGLFTLTQRANAQAQYRTGERA